MQGLPGRGVCDRGGAAAAARRRAAATTAGRRRRAPPAPINKPVWAGAAPPGSVIAGTASSAWWRTALHAQCGYSKHERRTLAEALQTLAVSKVQCLPISMWWTCEMSCRKALQTGCGHGSVHERNERKILRRLRLQILPTKGSSWQQEERSGLLHVRIYTCRTNT